MLPTHLSLEVTGDRPDVLHRVLGVCRQRGGEVLSCRFARGNRHRPSQLELQIAIDPRRRTLLAKRLMGLVDVQQVRER